jgi:L-fuculose-phosphate aldolase
MSAALRNRLLETARRMNASGINSGTSGNLSARLDGGMLITPSGMDYAAMQAADLVTVSADGEWAEGCRPSSEWRFHRDIYRAFPEAQAIVHAHPVHCTALACLRRSIPAFHYTVAIAGGEDIRCADHVLRALEGRRACLLANHGLVCHGADPPSALALAIEVENLARTFCQCLALGEPVILDRDEMARVLEKFRDYRSGRTP